MNLSELRSKYGHLMTRAQEIALKGFTPETRAKFDAIMNDANELHADIQRQEKIAQFQSEQRNAGAPPRAGFDNETRSEKEARQELEKRQLFQWMRTGSSAGVETRDLGVGTPVSPITGGSVLVPTTIGPLVSATKSYGNLLDFVSILKTAQGNTINIPTDNDTSNGLILTSQAAAVNSDTDPSLGSVPSNVDTATSGMVSISNELLQDAYFDIEAWLRSKLNTRWIRGASNWISQGNSSNVAALAATAGVTSAVSGTVEYQDLAQLFGSVDASYANLPDSAFVMSSATRAYLMGLVSTTGQPILQTDVHGTPFNSIFGKTICIDENRPAVAAGNVPILFGSLKDQYTFRTAGDYIIKRLSEIKALANETVFVLFTRVSGVNHDAGSHPVKSLTVHA